MQTSAAQAHAISHIAANAAFLSEGAARIFDFGETAWREYCSADWYVSVLRAHGFDVETGSGGMPTAFAAHWSNGPGPAILLYAEYDAVPGNCQAASVMRGPRPGLSVHAGGHTDPHSGLGMAGPRRASRAAIGDAASRYRRQPALYRRACRKGARLQSRSTRARGYYDGLDAILSFHPFYMLPMCNTVRWETHCGAAYAMIYRFVCDEPEGWGQSDGAPIPPIPFRHPRAGGPMTR